MKKIVLVNCYFGKFPWYFNFFLKSCQTNPTVDFIIFSDSEYDSYLPDNVKIIPFNLMDFNSLASTKLGFNITVRKAYKLCDFKPAYGFIFSDHLSGYDFWGICDIDIILGRIREFMTEELLNEYDIINTRHDYLTGSFLLFRNIPSINNLFIKSKDYKKVFTTDKHYCFDECNFKHIEMEQGINIFEVTCEIESMEHLVRKEMELGSINVFFDFLVVDGLSGRLKWDNGLLSYNNKFEILLFHLIQYKSNILSKKHFWTNIPNIFYIDKYTFRKKSKKSSFGFVDFFYHDMLKSSKFKIKYVIDYYTSIYFFPKLISGIEIGSYKNKLGSSIINIQKNKKGKNTLINYFSLESESFLIQSKFNKNTLFVKGILNQKFIKFNAEKTKENHIQINYLDGNISNYEMMN
nr:DUF6625 family protein [uncultured Flavobacterium sp.]